MILAVVPASRIEQKDVIRNATESRKSMTLPTAGNSPYGKAARPDTESRKPVVLSAADKIGRNDPCPCGSGKKYKKCCGANSAQESND